VQALTVSGTGIAVTGNITSTGTAHSFVAASIPRAAVAGVSEAQLDARYLTLTGGTLTGALTAPSISVNGNITSTGASHSFVAKSVPVTALSDFPIAPTGTPASQTAAGTVGRLEWDANYLYLAIAANQWRRIPWTDWHGNTLPGSGAGATDTALPADFTGGAAKIVPLSVNGITPIGRIAMVLGTVAPALSTGIKVQYRIHGGNWVDAVIESYWATATGAHSTNVSVKHPTFLAMKLDGGLLTVVLSGIAPGTPYITRMAWVSSLGPGLWSAEYAPVTPTA
jgi:hypothetical protein